MTNDGGQNVVAHLRRAAERTPERPAFIMDGPGAAGDRISFGGLWDRVDRISEGLARDGLAPGARVIVMIPMSLDLYAMLLGILKRGAAAVFVDPWVGVKTIASFCAFSNPAAFVGVPKSHLLRWGDGRLRAIPLAVTTGRRWWRFPAPRCLADLEAAPGNGRAHPAGPDDSALITFTTGSSGIPKGANRTHGFLGAQHEALRHEFPCREDDVDMPMFPVFALNNLATGIPSVVPRMDFRRVAGVDAAAVLDQMARHGVTTCTASPPFFDRIAARLDERPADRPRLRRILTGGAPVSDAQLRAWRRALPDAEIVVVYGSTEAEPVAHIRAEERLEAVSDARPRAPGYCVGRPTGHVRARLLRLHRGAVMLHDGGWPAWEAPTGEIGELLVAGAHVCKDYYRNPEAVAENKVLDSAGTVWHRMGDTGYFDGQGRFWLAGRLHSTIFRAGGAAHPQLIEQAAMESDARIRCVAAIGVPDAALGERVTVVVETADGESVREDVRRRVREAGLDADDVVTTTEPLPVDPRHNAKIDYPRLRARLAKAGAGRTP